MSNITPIFTTHSSIGRSILTNDDLVEYAEQSNEPIIVLEDSFYGFRDLVSKLDIFRFGVRLPVVQESLDSERPSRLGFFARDGNGVRALRKLYSKTYCSQEKALILSSLTPEDLMGLDIFVPFYTSYLAANIFNFGCEFLDLQHRSIKEAGCNVVFGIEDNNHPFDFLIKNAVLGVNSSPMPCKSIFYKNRSDFPAYQMYAAVCNRGQGREVNFGRPNLEHCCSDEFCIESL